MSKRTARVSRRGFSLVELLIVLGVIAVLIAIVIIVGQGVVSGQRRTLTQDAIRVLDNVVDEYEATTGRPMEPYVPNPSATSTTDVRQVALWPIADAQVPTEQNRTVNSAGLALVLAEGVAGGLTDKINTTAGVRVDQRAVLVDASVTTPPRAPFDRAIPTPLDAWGNPIRLVMPGFDGQIAASDDPYVRLDPALRIRLGSTVTGPGSGTPPQNVLARLVRDLTNSDGGRCSGNRPYFYSVGPDGDPAVADANADGQVTASDLTQSDNVYTATPEFEG